MIKLWPYCIFHHSSKLIHHENTSFFGSLFVLFRSKIFRLAPLLRKNSKIATRPRLLVDAYIIDVYDTYSMLYFNFAAGNSL